MPNVYPDSANNFGAVQVTVDNTGNTLLIGPRPSRYGFIITIQGDTVGQNLYYGPFPPVSVPTAGYLPCKDGANVFIAYNGPMYGLASVSTQNVSIEEIF